MGHHHRDLAGWGAPAISVSPSSWDFGSTPIGTPVTKEFTILNSGTGTLEISLPISIVGDGFTVTAQPAVTSLAPGASTTFTVQADADSVDVFNADISIVSNADTSPTLVAITVDVSALLTLLSKFDRSGGSAGWWRTETQYIMMAEIDNRRYIGMNINENEFLGADTIAPHVNAIRAYRPLYGVNQDSGAITKVGSWEQLNSSAIYKGNYQRSFSAGAYMEWTTPANTTRIGSFSLLGPGRSMVLVTLNGDATLANNLTTAQQLVDSGDLASTALIANGGTLNPTDRIWDQFEATLDSQARLAIELADDLPANTYTVRLSRTPYKNTADGAAFFGAYIGGFWSDSGVQNGDTVFQLEKTLMNIDSRIEYALSYKPTGATNFEFIGHNTTEYAVAAPTLKVDGGAITLAEWQSVGGTEASLEIDFYNRHPQTALTRVGEGTRSMTATAADGFRVQWELEWLVAGVISITHPAMLASDNTPTWKGSNVGSSADYVLDADDNSVIADARSQAIYMWESAGQFGMLLYLADLAAVNNWLDNPTPSLYILDKPPAELALNKVYSIRTNYVSEPISAGAIWNADYYWRFVYNADVNVLLER